jgi:RNA recognition motif-containing protein
MAVSTVRTQLPVSALENSQAGCPREGQPRSGMNRKLLIREVGMSKLFFVNIPYNCSDRELQEWVESRGIQTRSIRIIRDLVAGVSPAFGYVELADATSIKEAISILNGKKMRNQILSVREDRSMAASAVERRSA